MGRQAAKGKGRARTKGRREQEPKGRTRARGGGQRRPQRQQAREGRARKAGARGRTRAKPRPHKAEAEGSEDRGRGLSRWQRADGERAVGGVRRAGATVTPSGARKGELQVRPWTARVIASPRAVIQLQAFRTYSFRTTPRGELKPAVQPSAAELVAEEHVSCE
jgi:hypothetical protein